MLPLLVTIQNIFFDAADRLKSNEKGATAVEYGLIVGLIAVGIIAAVGLIGDDIAKMFQDTADAL